MALRLVLERAMYRQAGVGPNQSPALVLDGWQGQTRQEATNVAYWDAVAALNTPTKLDGPQGLFDEHGAPLDEESVTRGRDRFLREALDQLQA